MNKTENIYPLILPEEGHPQTIVDADHPGMDEKSLIYTVATLHNEISDHGREMIRKAVHIGWLLAEQKARLEHGQFIPWVAENMPFGHRTANRYMKIFENRGKLDNVTNLITAHNLSCDKASAESKLTGEEPEEKFILRFPFDTDQHTIVMHALNAAKEMLDSESNSQVMELICYDWFQAFADKSEPSRIKLEDVKQWVEKTFDVRATFHDKTGKIV
ncbi:hypothetical protein LCGC14_1989050 [marine sediment metagenome]|uniref:DUF3102 domain-containing protein n=1 Tax=marine sediment metagenome TaxID=412755 RepID=A0A0F9I3N4_9ZZZZ